MSLTIGRIDLADTGSPEGLVKAILKNEPNLTLPVPIEELCLQLDIVEIKPLVTEGFEGGLITQSIRTNGIILVKDGVHHKRKRFTIAHELGHFLIASHVPSIEGSFLCSRQDMLLQNRKEQSKRARMEVEANRFASLLLMPPPILRPLLSGKHHPNLNTVIEIHKKFNVSKEAAARAYAEFNPETVAVVIVKDKRFQYVYRNRKFPWINVRKGEAIPASSQLHSDLDLMKPSSSDLVPAEDWIDSEQGKLIPKMYEQVMLQQNGYALIQLRIFERGDDEFDMKEELTAKERYAFDRERWGRN